MLLFGGFSKLRNEGSIPVPNAFAIFGLLLSVALKTTTVGWTPHGVAQWFRRSQGDVWFRVRSRFDPVFFSFFFFFFPVDDREPFAVFRGSPLRGRIVTTVEH